MDENNKDNKGVHETEDKLNSKEVVSEPVNLIEKIINSHVLRVCHLRENAFKSLKQAAETKIHDMKYYKKILDDNINLIDHLKELEKVIVIKNILESEKKLDRLIQTDVLNDLAIGYFLSLYATFDSFTGDLLKVVYTKKPELFKSIDRSMSISEMLIYGSVDDIKKIILSSEIDAFRRKSYVEQFEELEKRFGLTLRKFNNWSKFVESSQRRNLFAHCDGIVSEQYLAICRNNGSDIPEDLKSGTKLKLSPKYLRESFHLIIEVIMKLGQTIWRKMFPDEIKDADKQLISTQYDFLCQSYWEDAIIAGDYALALPKHSSTVDKIILLINYVIALNNTKDHEKAKKLLASQDWSALCNDFRLAERVLSEDYDAANELMIKIGKTGDFVCEHSYHVWPLFYKFRQSEQFLNGYAKIYGYDFSAKLKEAAEESSAEAEVHLSKQEEDN